MKVVLLVLLAALALGGLVGALVNRDPGYVLVAYQDMALETSLWFAVVLLLLAFLVAWLLGLLLRRFGGGGGRLKGWQQRRRDRVARAQTVKGLLLLAEARWAEARRLLEASAPRAEAPLINYLGAARAAHESGDIAVRDRLLQAARDSAPDAPLVVGLTQAELQQAQGQWEQCLATLLELDRLSPRHPQLLRLLVACYRQLGDWPSLLELVGDLKKRRVLNDDELLSLQLEAWQGRLGVASGGVAAGGVASGGVADRATSEDPERLYRDVPRELKRHPALVAGFARALEVAGRASAAENLVREALAQSWDDRLVHLYGTLVSNDPGRQLVAAEGWLKRRPNNPELLLALGRIGLMNQLWAKAREYLEASLRLRRSTETQGELGRLCIALGETERGCELLAQALDGLPDLPLPERAPPPSLAKPGESVAHS